MYIRDWSLGGGGRGITTAKRAIVAAAAAAAAAGATTILDYRLFGRRLDCRVEGVDVNVRRRRGFSSVRVSRSVRDARRPSVVRCALTVVVVVPLGALYATRARRRPFYRRPRVDPARARFSPACRPV